MPTPRGLPAVPTDRAGLTLTELLPTDADDYYALLQASRADLTRHGDYIEETEAGPEEVRAGLAVAGLRRGWGACAGAAVRVAVGERGARGGRPGRLL
ncbi:hypothetical protein AB0I28_25995 [Phytomonospora sp. NPDC050363]|uniref:hypothetical protein n=1 Tax=Phytomonospora sp. NPDC050363 TaxID=3155642 RepID=UPI0033D0D36D